MRKSAIDLLETSSGDELVGICPPICDIGLPLKSIGLAAIIYANDMQARATCSQIAKAAGVHTSSVAHAMKPLIAHGWFTRIPKHCDDEGRYVPTVYVENIS